MWQEEYTRVRAAAQAVGLKPKRLDAQDEWSPCPFQDPVTKLCRVYLARPLVCRTFGLVPWFPCPLGRVEPLPDETAQKLICGYTARPRCTYWEWAESHGA